MTDAEDTAGENSLKGSELSPKSNVSIIASSSG
ncbi:Uncharacterised protein [Mycobacteroides abscessus subsp. abscessus]|nr:Uncharacterised protein [Mycobacteroides abscessus subsp. abscessus]